MQAAPDSAILRVGFEAASPAAAAGVLERLVQLFLEKHVSVHRTSGAYEFLSEQMEMSDAQLAKLRERLAHIRTETGIYSFDEQRRALAERITALEKEAADLQAANDASSAKSDSLRREIRELEPVEIVSETLGDASPVADTIRTRLVELQIREQELLGELQPDSPQVRNVRERIALTRAMLADEAENRAMRTRGPNEVRRQLELELFREQAELAGRTRRLQGTTEPLTELRRRLDFVNGHELDLRGLEREIEVVERNRANYAESLEQARIDRALEVQKISNIRVVQSPSTPLRPVGPGRTWILAVGAVLALFMGLGVVFFAEYVDESLHDPDSAETALGILAIGSVPNSRFLRRLPARLLHGEDPRADRGAANMLATSAAITGRVLSILAATRRDGPAIIGVVGNAYGAGATTVASCVAINLAGRGKGPVLLLDASGEPPSRREDRAARPSGETLPSSVAGLSLLRLPADAPAEAGIREHASGFAYVVVDFAPPNRSEVTAETASMCDGMLIVVSPDRSRGIGARRTVQNLRAARGRLLGAVVNKRRYPIPRWLYRLL